MPRVCAAAMSARMLELPSAAPARCSVRAATLMLPDTSAATPRGYCLLRLQMSAL